MAVASCAVAAPTRAQVLSARPASVSLTVVVPTRPSADGAVATEGAVTLLGATRTAIDLETVMRLPNQPPTRVEVSLAPAWNVDSGRVWVRNQRGEMEPLVSGGAAGVVPSPSTGGVPARLRLRVEPGRFFDRSLTLPLEYRVRVGSGDEFSVWTFPSLLRVAPE